MGDRFEFGTDEGDAGSEFLKHGLKEPGGAKGHAAFADDNIAPFEFPVFNGGAISADVAGVEGDVEAFEWQGA